MELTSYRSTESPATATPISKTTTRVGTRWMVLMFFLALAVAMIFNGQRALWDTSETRYAESAREMATGGNWLVPHLEGELHLTKPPVTYWVLAASIKFISRDEWAVRLPSALAFAFSVVLTMLIAAEVSGSATVGKIAGLLQLVSPLALLGSHVVTTDGILATLELAYVWAFWKSMNANRPNQWRLWAMIGWALAGIAFLTKGPPALLLALACLIFLVVRRKEDNRWKRVANPIAIALFLIVALSWYVVVLIRVPHALNVWKAEAVHKVFVSSTRDMPAVTYLPILAVGALPAVIVLCARLWKDRAERSTWYGRIRKQPAILFCVLWIVAPLIIFMVSKTRLPLYVLPLIPAFNILAAMELEPKWTSGGLPGKLFIPAGWKAAMAVGAFLFIAGKLATRYFDDESKSMRPLAQAIRVDSEKIGKKPMVILTMPVMGNGLLYYLDGPANKRIATNEESPGAELDENIDTVKKEAKGLNKGRSSRMAGALRQDLAPGYAQYLVFQSDGLPKYDKRFGDLTTPVIVNSRWVVWRRTRQLAPDDNRGPKK